jgi:ribosomal protein S18 acetylase RimI-like enzyme
VREALLALFGEVRTRTWSDEVLLVLQRRAGGTAAPTTELIVREARHSDAPAYERDIGTETAGRVAERLSRPGASCWIAETGGHMVHASWVETKAAWVGEIERLLVVPPGDAYIYQSFTRPEMRGRGIYPAVLTTLSERLGSRGINCLWIAVEATNPASLRAIQKSGFTHVFEIAFQHRFGRIQVSVPDGVAPSFEKKPPS